MQSTAHSVSSAISTENSLHNCTTSLHRHHRLCTPSFSDICKHIETCQTSPILVIVSFVLPAVTNRVRKHEAVRQRSEAKNVNVNFSNKHLLVYSLYYQLNWDVISRCILNSKYAKIHVCQKITACSFYPKNEYFT